MQTNPATLDEYRERKKQILDNIDESMELLKTEAETELKTIRSSYTHAAAGISKSSRLECWLRVAFGLKKPEGDWVSNLQHYGNEHEAHALGEVERITGRLFWHTGDRQKQYRVDRYTCHPDGEDEEVIAEVKSRAPELEAYKEGDENWIKHMAQVQQNLFLTDREMCIFSCYVRGGESRIWEVYRSDEYIKKLHGHLEEFLYYLDGARKIPKTIGRRRSMPKVKAKLIHGEQRSSVKPDLIKSISRERAKKADTIEELNAMEAELAKEFGPGTGHLIVEAMQPYRDYFEEGW